MSPLEIPAGRRVCNSRRTAFVATHIAAAAAAVSWMTAEWLHRGKPTMLGVASGIIAGLATITPAAGFVTPLPAMLIGLVAGTASYIAVVWKVRFGYDDSLDVVGIHGVAEVSSSALSRISRRSVSACRSRSERAALSAGVMSRPARSGWNTSWRRANSYS